jgi:predicted RNase H-like nuclease (RuvC/YqgF family)
MRKKQKVEPTSPVDTLVIKRLKLIERLTELATKISKIDANIQGLQNNAIREYWRNPKLSKVHDLVAERTALSKNLTEVEVKIVELENELNSLEMKSSRPMKDGGRIRSIRAIEERPVKERIYVRVVAAPTKKQEKENWAGKSNIGSNVYWIPLEDLEIVRKVPR